MADSSEFGNWQVAIDNILDSIQYSDEFKSFSQQRSNESRVKCVFTDKLLKHVQWLPLYFDACKTWHGKSVEVARVWKNKGNKLFQQKRYIDAVNAYTQSCLNAPVESDDFSLSLGNRSAALFYLGKYQECVLDINRALGHRFPSDSRHKLLARRTSAFVKQGQRSEAEDSYRELNDFVSSKQFNLQGTKRDDFLKEVDCLEKSISNMTRTAAHKNETKETPVVSFGQNTVVCQATDAVSFHYTNEQGRHLVANRHIPKGSTLIVERPFAAVLLPEHYDTHCHYCFSLLPLTAIGCQRCISVRFCGEKCRDVAWSSYHKIECPYLDLYHSIGIAHLSLRIILCAGLDFLLDFLTQQSKYRQSEKASEKGINPDGKYDRSYLTVYDLMTHEDSTSSQDMLQYSLTAALLLMTLVHANFFKKVTSSGDSNQLSENFANLTLKGRNKSDLSKEMYMIGGLLLRHILQLVCNAHAITSLQATSSEQVSTQDTEQVRIATAIYPTASLMNHSCDPTIISSFINDVLVVKAVKDVEVGEEIFNCYGPHYCRMSREERQEVLKSQYHFDCLCQPCSQSDLSHLRFSAFKCPVCAGVVSGHSCRECGHLLSEKVLNGLKLKAEKANRQFNEAIRLMNSQDYDGAIHVLEDCRSQRQSFLYKDHKDLGQIEDAIARCYADQGDFSSSADHLFTSVKMMSQMYGERSIEHANELQKLAEVLFNAERFTECLDVASQSLSLFECLYSSGHEAVKQLMDLKDAAVRALTPLMQAN
ncbi:unnamed protein product [Candidula unifasciata]|uniref:Protein-lysine N-methyltransferase SMYD4 n=1 Tax=Candidula unifasciata TaxID=100452 RepID=A0A8S3ZVE7_9EUPU|nr:unnamed protein product [Candidula unifasciata]